MDDQRLGRLSFDQFTDRLVQLGISPKLAKSVALQDALARLTPKVAGHIEYKDFTQLLASY